MTLTAALSLLVIMLALAAVPSASVALVVTRAATRGVSDGAAVALGIVLADLVFVTLAILGMSVLAEAMGSFFAILRYAGAAYLIWMGIGLLRSRHRLGISSDPATRRSLLASFTGGFLLTLGDVKAILFYAALFPTLVDMSRLTVGDIGLIVIVTLFAVGGVKLVYALAARKIVERFQGGLAQANAQSVAGCLMIGAGGYLVAKG